MILFGIAFGLLELLFLGVFIVALIISTATDRYGNDHHKWWVIMTFLVIIGAWYWPHWSFFGPAHVDAVVDAAGKVTIEAHDRVVLFQVLTSPVFWKPVSWFLAVGLVYAVFEFFFGVWRAAREYRERWAEHLKNEISNRHEALNKAIMAGTGSNDWTYASVLRASKNREAVLAAYSDGIEMSVLESATRQVLREFSAENTKARFIVAAVTENEMQPQISKWRLTRWLTAWTFLWPAYALSLIFGDLLREVFIAFTDALVAMSGRIVRATFADVFKI